MERLLPYLPQLITFAIKLGSSILEMTRELTLEEMQRMLDKTYDEIAVKERLRRNADGVFKWQ